MELFGSWGVETQPIVFGLGSKKKPSKMGVCRPKICGFQRPGAALGSDGKD